MRQFCGSKENYSPCVGALWKSKLWISGWGWGALLTLAKQPGRGNWDLCGFRASAFGLVIMPWNVSSAGWGCWFKLPVRWNNGSHGGQSTCSGNKMPSGARAVICEHTQPGEAMPAPAPSNKRAPNRPGCALCWASALIAIILPKTDHTCRLQRRTRAITWQKGSSS